MHIVICCWHITDKFVFTHNPISPKWGCNEIMTSYACMHKVYCHTGYILTSFHLCYYFQEGFDLSSVAYRRSEQTKQWRGTALFTNNTVPLQCFVYSERRYATAIILWPTQLSEVKRDTFQRSASTFWLIFLLVCEPQEGNLAVYETKNWPLPFCPIFSFFLPKDGLVLKL